MANNLEMQNQNIKENLAKVNLAVNTLHALGLAVNTISVDHCVPMIDIDSGRGCTQLSPGVTRYITREGSRFVQHEALMSECKVRWEERP